ncbi:MAG TPA: Dabb family protein [Methylomirabilota bacterium]|nr:Dabb family protein [Methylomirabilota bacterium]
MITHIVFVRYRADVSVADKDAINADLAALRDRIPGMTGFASGPNVSPEGLGRGNDDGFVVTFDSFDARDAYLADDVHRSIGARIVAAAEGGLDGLTVFDLES